MTPHIGRATVWLVSYYFDDRANKLDRGGLRVNRKIGLIRASVVALAFAVLGPAIAQSQVVVICGVYRDSYADTAANLCHGRGPGCIECTIFMYKEPEGGGPTGPPSEGPAVAANTPGFDYTHEPIHPVSLAEDTGLASAREELPACEAPSLYDQVRVVRRERVPVAVKGRSLGELWKQASAR